MRPSVVEKEKERERAPVRVKGRVPVRDRAKAPAQEAGKAPVKVLAPARA
jgi:hypothetical protein